MDNFNIDEHKYNHVHFIGIGGISMSAIAQILLNYNYSVSGSDRKSSPITDKLESLGAKIYFEHSPKNIKNADLIIYTDAISLDNQELEAAIKSKVDIIDRASFLGQLMKNYKTSIAVSGTHGKTSTTSMLTEILLNTEENPTILLGGNLDEIGGNVKIGDKDLLLTEACEYRANILKYFPTTSIVLNIDEDHLDFFDNIEHIISTFEGLVKNLTVQDTLVLNVDDEKVKNLQSKAVCKVITCSAKDQSANYFAKNINLKNECPTYDLYHNGEFKGEVQLSVLGEHNVYNSLCAIAAAYENNMPLDIIIKSLKKYTGVHRRLEFKGVYNNASVIDDYAHHPTEIKASLKALKTQCKSRLFCIFQPHTFTRTKLLLDSFSKSFDDTDLTIITDIYAAREKDYGDIHSKTLVDAIINYGDKAVYMSDFSDIVTYLKNELQPNDIVVTMGAGDVFKIGDDLLK
ncbi:UDP-N-acetylmuramate--L-alanine ligase [Peptoniphilus asaccharolyticus DSM 20463]|uniref:UDP-N-acetylmuramate--L-alanine ligase n=1 Tax=Peptoniphilus asaccharolyticus DSM 20463 TaxID=573058 RepID=A0A1W1UQB5_PEPAS|nr:UDP-N-acetylmuramate--L-alanine ligase [Peptoniphilus asaccharolyticus]MBL7575032.1 UDP-N-acetylmuramate--L-alanine ligase [Peptoniphilus asaccharolyticus]MBL7575055.1 UDP-N-acetylmuramate--L-alanine ligase [Peptoniphilus asaccharolyticus]SMB83325.1 UDP-N-acetylmuramate--L-alanine ligase [Peptoniphilus asaccharolyticus DSM 20463]